MISGVYNKIEINYVGLKDIVQNLHSGNTLIKPPKHRIQRASLLNTLIPLSLTKMLKKKMKNIYIQG